MRPVDSHGAFVVYPAIMETLKAAKPVPEAQSAELRDTVAAIIEGVRAGGDEALADYTQRFDAASRQSFRVPPEEARAALDSLDRATLDAMRFALHNIDAFARAQRESITDIRAFSPLPGLRLGQRAVPVDAACCYIPGGSYPLFSTALMLITPAKAAGVRRIAACSPVIKGSSSIHPATLAAMTLAGADEIYALGGAQAIAAFAYGTPQIKPVDLIVGPGNAYVAEAKRQCFGQVGIDTIAGPSETLIIADNSARSAIAAADILAQCEHDPLAQGILVTTSLEFAQKTLADIESQLAALPFPQIARASWQDYGAVYLADTLDEAACFANERAAEHVELHTRENTRIAALLRNYGALFIGEHTAEVFGDYASGTNHTLPTLRAARWTGGVWPGTFLKTLCFQEATAEAAAALAPTVSLLAETEGLIAHSRAARARD